MFLYLHMYKINIFCILYACVEKKKRMEINNKKLFREKCQLNASTWYDKNIEFFSRFLCDISVSQSNVFQTHTTDTDMFCNTYISAHA